jgi:hypothetical protein
MKTIVKSLIVAVTIAICSISPKTSVAQDQPVTSLQTFYDQLAPYGQWINYPNYGYVFIPSAGPGFVPYSTAGHWAYADQYGWMWASDYPWGWATFHYGRWNYDYNYGWFWVPDLQWGPAWVAWRNSDQYYGWAPLPSGVDLSIGFNSGFGIPADHWCFVPNQYISDPFISRYYMSRGNNDLFLRNTVMINRMNYDGGHRYNYFAGPDRYEVERYHHGPIQVYTVNSYSDAHHVDGRNEFGIYHPAEVRHDDGGRHDAVPVRVVKVEEVPQRDANHQHNDWQRQDVHQDNHQDNRQDNHVNDNHGGNNNRGNDNHGNDNRNGGDHHR